MDGLRRNIKKEWNNDQVEAYAKTAEKKILSYMSTFSKHSPHVATKPPIRNSDAEDDDDDGNPPPATDDEEEEVIVVDPSSIIGVDTNSDDQEFFFNTQIN